MKDNVFRCSPVFWTRWHRGKESWFLFVVYSLHCVRDKWMSVYLILFSYNRKFDEFNFDERAIVSRTVVWRRVYRHWSFSKSSFATDLLQNELTSSRKCRPRWLVDKASKIPLRCFMFGADTTLDSEVRILGVVTIFGCHCVFCSTRAPVGN